MIIRDAVDTDMKETTRICNACWERFYPDYMEREKIEKMLENRRKNPTTKTPLGTIVAEENGTVVGFCYFTGNEIVALYIHPDLTGRGIGCALIQEAMHHISRGHKTIRTSTLLKNTRALRFYKREGFKETSEGKHSHRGVDMDVVFLEREVTS